MPIRVLLADDHALLRQGLQRLLETEGDIAIIGEASTGVEAELLADSLHPDVVLMDMEMPEKSGGEAIEAIIAKHPEIGIVVLTMHDGDEQLQEALQAGARGYLLKTTSAKEVVQAIKTVFDGKSLLDPTITTRMLTQYRRISQKAGRDDELALTERELAVLRLLGGGLSNKEIAQKLSYSESTVKNRLSVIFEKLGVQDRTQAVLQGVQSGILKLQSDPSAVKAR